MTTRKYEFSVISVTIFITIICSCTFLSATLFVRYAHGEEYIARVNQQVFLPGERLVVYGKGSVNDIFVVRLYDPSGRAIKIDSIPTDNDGFFKKAVYEWPDPSRNIAFGTYQVEISSSLGQPNTQRFEVTYAEGGSASMDETGGPVQHTLQVKLDSPTDVQINKSFRIYVQVTYDGALVDSDPSDLLGTSHIHSGNDTINLSDAFVKLHEGLYYADVVLDQEASYIIHASAFYRGFLSHDSKVVSASPSTINTVQESINNLEQELNQTQTSLENARTSIGKDIESAKAGVDEMRNASGQLNSLFLPVLALISVIIALQISLFARIRASYR